MYPNEWAQLMNILTHIQYLPEYMWFCENVLVLFRVKEVVAKLCIFNRMFVKNLKSDIKTTDISKGNHNSISLLHVLGTEIWLTPSRYNFSGTNRK